MPKPFVIHAETLFTFLPVRDPRGSVCFVDAAFPAAFPSLVMAEGKVVRQR